MGDGHTRHDNSVPYENTLSCFPGHAQPRAGRKDIYFRCVRFHPSNKGRPAAGRRHAHPRKFSRRDRQHPEAERAEDPVVTLPRTIRTRSSAAPPPGAVDPSTSGTSGGTGHTGPRTRTHGILAHLPLRPPALMAPRRCAVGSSRLPSLSSFPSNSLGSLGPMVTCRSRHAVGLVGPVEDHSNTINTMAAVFTNFLKRGRRIPRFHLLELLGILATTPQSADATQATRSSARTSSRIILKRIFGVRQKGVLGVLASKGGTGVHLSLIHI